MSDNTNYTKAWQKAIGGKENNPRYEIVEHGWEQHVLVDHQTQTVYRYPRTQNAANKLHDEVDILKSLNKLDLPVKIPIMKKHYTGHASYKYVEGNVLDEKILNLLSDQDFLRIGKKLGEFLATLHKADLSIVERRQNKQTMSLLEYYSKRVDSAESKSIYYQQAKADLASLIKQKTDQLVTVHGDLHGLNMVIDPYKKELLGVIDFSEVEIGSPNQDFRKIFMADSRLLKPAINSYRQFSDNILNENIIKLWAYVNEWANLCYFYDQTKHTTYKRAYRHLKKWNKI